ncbi:MAG: nuclease-related domain-containing protein [Bacillota bacterium]
MDTVNVIDVFRINLIRADYIGLFILGAFILSILLLVINLNRGQNTKNPHHSRVRQPNLVHYKEAEYLEKVVYNLLMSRYSQYINCVNILLEKNLYTTQIDNLLVTSKAIYCIECKDYKGLISIYEYGNNWYQNLSDGSYEIYNPIKQNATHINFLINNIKNINKLPIINLIVFSDECTLKNGTIKADRVHVIYKNELTEFIGAYETILKDKISYNSLLDIQQQLIGLDHFSLEKLEEHIDKIRKRNNLDE